MGIRVIRPLKLLIEGNSEAGELYLKVKAPDDDHVSIVISSPQVAELLQSLILSIAHCPNEDLRAAIGLVLAESIHAAPMRDQPGVTIALSLVAGVVLQQRLTEASARELLSELEAALSGPAMH